MVQAIVRNCEYFKIKIEMNRLIPLFEIRAAKILIHSFLGVQ